jgi:hypothetical protein
MHCRINQFVYERLESTQMKPMCLTIRLAPVALDVDVNLDSPSTPAKALA